MEHVGAINTRIHLIFLLKSFTKQSSTRDNSTGMHAIARKILFSSETCSQLEDRKEVLTKNRVASSLLDAHEARLFGGNFGAVTDVETYLGTYMLKSSNVETVN